MISHSRTKSSRLQRRSLSNVFLYLSVCLLSGIVIAVMLLLGIRVEFVIAIIGILLTILVFLVQEVRLLRSPLRKIVFLGRSNSPFSLNILAGLKAVIGDGAFSADLQIVLPVQKHEKGDLTFQINCLRRIETRSTHALVIVPAGDSESLWNELRRLISKGVFVVSIDVKAPNRFFYEGNLRLPRFVTSDFAKGGHLVAELIGEYLTEGAADVALLLIGPATSSPGSMRTRMCLYELVSRGFGPRIFAAELENWNVEEAIRKFKEALSKIEPSKMNATVRICVFCGNDANCVAINQFIEKHPEIRRRREYVLIGYDGVRNPDGSLIVDSMKLCMGTVDQLPESQGKSAGTFLVEEYERRTSANSKNAFLSPQLLRRSTWR
jgi:ABC-type sugar transport system substrate-binding protein